MINSDKKCHKMTLVTDVKLIKVFAVTSKDVIL